MNRLLGSILLIIALSIGGGMLALPVVTAASGFIASSILLIIIWLFMTLCALVLLEVNLSLPSGKNLITMARETLGRPGAAICWVLYLILLYCLLAAYSSAGSDLVQHLYFFNHFAPIKHAAVSTLIFILFFSLFTWFGILTTDWFNRLLMTIKLLSLLFIILLLTPNTNINLLPPINLAHVSSMLLVGVTAFGFSVIIPTLRVYLHNDVKKLKQAIVIGSFTPLICYIIWDYVVQGSIHTDQLINISRSSAVVSQLTVSLSQVLHSSTIFVIISLFTTVCVLTAFLGVSLSLFDFLADGLKFKKTGSQKFALYLFTFLPPYLITVISQKFFIIGLRYAGIIVIILMSIGPIFMAWSNRYWIGRALPYRVMGGKLMLILLLIFSIIILTV